jgi:uncharacterized protein YeaO (DUF488 family)
MSNIFMKRIYESYDETDGCRILIDRLWPRGISKEAAKLSYWLKDLAPSNELRKWDDEIWGQYAYDALEGGKISSAVTSRR